MKFEEKELDVRDLKTGDLICMRYEMLPNAVAIRAFINMNKPKHLQSPYNHIAMVIMVEGKPYIVEAKGSGTSKLESAVTRLDGKKIAVLRPKFAFGPNQFQRIAIEYSARGTKYDFKGTFFEQAIFQLTGYKKNKSGVEGDEKLYCSEYYARVINRMFPERYPDYYMIDPQDLYIDKEYETIFEGKAVTKC